MNAEEWRAAADPVPAQEHVAAAERILEESHRSIDLAFLSRAAARAQAHATVALALEQRNTNVWLQDIAGQLDRRGEPFSNVVIIPEGTPIEDIVGEIERIRELPNLEGRAG